MMKTKRLAAIFAAMMMALALVSCSNNDDEKTDSNQKSTEPSTNALSSLKAVDGIDGVYTLEYTGEYFLDGAINASLKTADELVAYLTKNIPEWKTAKESVKALKINVGGAACSSIVVKNKDGNGYIYGRNFDWDPGNSLIIHTKPDSGYEAVSTCYMAFFTQDPEWKPTGKPDHDAIAIGGIYVPMDGMNEKGLYIANLNDNLPAVMPSSPDTSKKDVQTTVAIRYILDKCATVDEAVAFLKTINMYPVYANEEGSENAYHFAIADNTGKSVVAEWDNEELKVTDTKIVTNHNLYNESQTPTTGEDREHGTFRRYDSLKEKYDTAKGKMSAQEVTKALIEVQQKHSVWSAVFEPSAKKVTYYFRSSSATEETSEPIDYDKPVVVEF